MRIVILHRSSTFLCSAVLLSLSLLLFPPAPLPPAHAQSSDFPGSGNQADWLKANGYANLGAQLYQQKKFKEAAARYEEAVQVYPHDYHYHYSLGLSLKKSGDANGAVNAFKASAALNGKHWQTWKGLANCLFQLGKRDECKQAYESALACNPPAREVIEIKKMIASLAAGQPLK